MAGVYPPFHGRTPAEAQAWLAYQEAAIATQMLQLYNDHDLRQVNPHRHLLLPHQMLAMASTQETREQQSRGTTAAGAHGRRRSPPPPVSGKRQRTAPQAPQAQQEAQTASSATMRHAGRLPPSTPCTQKHMPQP